MNSSQLTRYRASHNSSAFYETIQRGGSQSALSIREGAGPLILRNQIIISAIIPSDAHIPDLKSYPLLDSILSSFEIFLQWIVTNGMGPTVTARALYIWNMALSTSWSWIQESTSIPLEGIHDNWNWNMRSLSSLSEKQRYVWMNHAMAGLMEGAFPGLSLASILSTERTVCGWTEGIQAQEVSAVQSLCNWSEFSRLWRDWLALRNKDGSSEAIQTQPSSADVPNIDQEIQTDSDIMPPLVNPQSWTPLKIPGKARQTYLTFGWGSIRSTGVPLTMDEGQQLLSEFNLSYDGVPLTMESALDKIADFFFVPPGQTRDQEVDDIVTLTSTLTDVQKVSAEFWAGGPHTVTPPGMMAWFWKEYIRSQRDSLPITRVIFSGLDLAIHLFEGSRITWRQKARKVQARPIQDIRIRRASDLITSWNGETVLGALWTPYQETDFVTPPFADFPSGHSHFSQAFANTMRVWFGETIPNIQIAKTDLALLSPAFNGSDSQTGTIGEYIFPSGNSQIQSGSVPAVNVKLSWTTWQDMADSAGMSRLYGGIHCLSAHTSSQAIANALHIGLESVWGFKR
jgi:hypothetical protein